MTLTARPQILWFAQAWLNTGWAERVRLTLAPDGDIETLETGAAPDGAERIEGIAIPGMPNAHGHAFQRAMAGLAEHAGASTDSFWTWREAMYRLALVLSPDDLRAIAAQTYVEMLQAGYTSAAEFHYLHNMPDGRAYTDPAEMSAALIEAAREAGMALTLLPTLYMTSDFGGVAPLEQQRRFVQTPDRFLQLVETLRTIQAPDLTIGIGFHSLRAVPPEAMDLVLKLPSPLRGGVGGGGIDSELGSGHPHPPAPSPQGGGGVPIHIHAAEQVREVEACLAWCGRRPVDHLLERQLADASWNIVHATHMTRAETAALAKSGATAVLCPTTEANLGDGLFPLKPYLDKGGAIAIGSDSHVTLSPTEELRWLEYGQRLSARRRLVAASPKAPNVGARLWRIAAEGGANALGRHAGALEVGRRADLIVLDADAPSLAGRSGDGLIDSLVFAPGTPAIRHVMVGGQWRVRDGAHPAAAEIAARYRRTVEALMSRV